MTDGRSWHEIPFLKECYEKAFKDALEDEDFRMMTFEKSFTYSAKRALKEWTVDERERKTLLIDMVDSAMDERRKV